MIKWVPKGCVVLSPHEAEQVVPALRELAAIKGRNNLLELSERIKRRIKGVI